MAIPDGCLKSLQRIGEARVMCLGDVMLDHFLYGEVTRISPEAPVPVFRIVRETLMLGGAGNVARNLSALTAESVFVAGIGDDFAGREVARLLGAEAGVEPCLETLFGRRTTEKSRFVAGVQQLLRADREEVADIEGAAAAAVLATVRARLPDCRVLALSDYGKGLLSPALLSEVLALAAAAGVPTIVDPKGRDYSRYRGAFLATPNRAELAEATGMPVGGDDQIVSAARHLIESCGIANILVTRSQDGMTLVEGAGGVRHIPARAREVFDVSGAGDTVVATMAAVLAVGGSLFEAAVLANLAGGIVVGKVGTATASLAELYAAVDVAGGNDDGKRMALDHARTTVAAWRDQGLSVGFTNGCFDLLHPGHISLLSQARAACDRLVVGLNSDASVRRLKGAQRPVQDEEARARVLGALAAVDAVVVFEEDTPIELIDALAPDVLVKGADYTVETVVGAELVLARGGRVVLARLEDGFSTTRTVNKLTQSRS